MKNVLHGLHKMANYENNKGRTVLHNRKQVDTVKNVWLFFYAAPFTET